MKSVLLYIDDALYERLKVHSKKEELSIVSAVNRIIAARLDGDAINDIVTEGTK